MENYVQFQNFTNGNNAVETGSPYTELCKEIDNWFMMSSPWPVATVVVVYLYFVIKVGPELMKDKKPFNIKPIMLVYNLYQTAYNSFIVLQMFIVPGGVNYLWTHGCRPMDPNVNPYLRTLNAAAWHYFITKMMDLLDTVFFILRKKDSHVTFLHVYHHSNMVLATWSYLKYIKGEQGAIVGWINAVVHTCMYSYYFLATLGPSVRKYLWWKKYLTRLQMTQFVLVIAYMMSLIVGRCDLPISFSYFVMIEGIIFLALFTNFYVKVYIQQENSKSNLIDNQLENDKKLQ